MDSFSSAQPNLFAGGEQQWFKNPMPTLAAAMAAPQPPMPVAPAGVRVQAPWYRTRWIWIALMIVLVLAAIAYVSRGRLFGPAKASGPYATAIAAINSAERQADLREWAQLWETAKRPAVKRVLAEVLNSELTPVSGSNPNPQVYQAPSNQTVSLPMQAVLPQANSTSAPAAGADPAFTVA
jgi:hypothetical protein